MRSCSVIARSPSRSISRLAGLLAAFNPRFMQPLWTDPIGITLLKSMVALMLLGVVLIARIVRIRV